MLKEAARSIKNVVYYDDIQILVREATSNSKQIPTPATLKRIGSYMINHDSYSTIFSMLWKRLCDLQYKRHVVKALLCIDYLVRLNPPSAGVQLRLIVDIKEKFNDLERLAHLRIAGNGAMTEIIAQIQRVAERLVEFITRVESGDVVLNEDVVIETNKKVKKKKKKKDTESHNNSTEIELLPNDTVTNFLTEPQPQTKPPINQYGFDFLLDDNTYLQTPTPKQQQHTHQQQLITYEPTDIQHTWKCPNCSFNNRADALECQVCQTNQYGQHKHVEQKVQQVETVPATTNKQAVLAAGGWACSWCSYLNTAHSDTCEVCDRGRVASNFANVVKLEYLRKQQTKQQQTDKSWVCTQCTFANKPTDVLCAICNTPNPKSSQSAVNDALVQNAKRQADNGALDNDIDVFSYTTTETAPAILQRKQQTSDRRSTMPAKLTQSLTPTNARALPTVTESSDDFPPVTQHINTTMHQSQPYQAQRLRLQTEQLSQSHNVSPKNAINDGFTELANKRAQSNNVSPSNRAQTQRTSLPTQQFNKLSLQSNNSATEKHWECKHCTYQNDGMKLVCEMCNTPKVQSILAAKQATQPIQQTTATSQQWTCMTCTYINNMTDKQCQMCNNTPSQRIPVQPTQHQSTKQSFVPAQLKPSNSNDLLTIFDTQTTPRAITLGGPHISPNVSPDMVLPTQPQSIHAQNLPQLPKADNRRRSRSKHDATLHVSHSTNFSTAPNGTNIINNDVVRSTSLDSLLLSPNHNRITPFDTTNNISNSTSVVPTNFNHSNKPISDPFADLINEQEQLQQQQQQQHMLIRQQQQQGTVSPYYTSQQQYNTLRIQPQPVPQQIPDEILSPRSAALRRRTLPQSMWSPANNTVQQSQSVVQPTRQLSFGELFDQSATNFATDWVSTQTLPSPLSNPFDNIQTPKQQKQQQQSSNNIVDLFDTSVLQQQQQQRGVPALPPPRKAKQKQLQEYKSDTSEHNDSGSKIHTPTNHNHNNNVNVLNVPDTLESRGLSEFDVLSPNLHTNEQPEHAEQIRTKIVQEIFQSEITYVDYLYECIANYLDPLKRQADKLNLTQKQISSIFSNLTVLTQFHAIFLTDLRTAIQGNTGICSVFIQYADFLKMYTQYLNSYEKAIATINSLRDNKKFQLFLKNKLDELQGKSLMYYLIMPVQRIPRYVLLLRELKKYTSVLHTEYSNLCSALDKLENIAEYINNSKKYVENMSKLLDIQNRISGLNGVIYMPTRRLLHEGKLKLIDTSSNDEMLVFLFNDLYLYTNNQFDVCGKIELHELQLHDTDITTNTFTLYHKSENKELKFQCDTPAEYTEWTNYIKSALSAQNTNNKSTILIKSNSIPHMAHSESVDSTSSAKSPKLVIDPAVHTLDTSSISSSTVQNNTAAPAPPPLPSFNKKKISPAKYHELEL